MATGYTLTRDVSNSGMAFLQIATQPLYENMETFPEIKPLSSI